MSEFTVTLDYRYCEKLSRFPQNICLPGKYQHAWFVFPPNQRNQPGSLLTSLKTGIVCSWLKTSKAPSERMRPYKLPYTPCSAAAEWETDSNSSPSGALTLSTGMTLNSPSHVRDLSRGIRSETDNLFHRNVNSCTDTVSFLILCLNVQISQVQFMWLLYFTFNRF